MNMNIFQAFEQISAMLRDLSPLLWSYKENLKKQGFTEEQAFQMAKDMQDILIRQNK